MTRCSNCKTRIVTHLWIVGERVFCSPSCERGGKSQFERLYRLFADANKAKPHPDMSKKK